MSEAAAAHHDAHDDHHIDYVGVWKKLVILLVISVVGPMFEIPWLTMVTAFGIAVVKATMVARNFMHINIEPKYVVYMLLVMLTFMGLFIAGVSPDVLRHEGANWSNDASKAHIEQQLEIEAAEGFHGHH